MKFISGALLAAGVVLTPAEVERELVHIVEQLEKGSAIQTRLAEELAEVALTYELHFAQQMVRASERSAEQRKAAVMLACEDDYRAMKLLESKLRMVRESQHDLRAELEAVRSIGASVRASMFEGQGSGGNNGARTPQGRPAGDGPRR